MAVVVVQTDADHADARAHGREKIRIEVRRAVVRHLEHVGADVDALCQHRLLRLDLDITWQQDGGVADSRAEHQRRVVRVGAGVVEGDLGRQHLQMHLAHIELAADRRSRDRQPVLGQHALHHCHPTGRLGERSGDHPIDGPAVENADDAADVVEVVVAEDQ